jgi:hypothetical protein
VAGKRRAATPPYHAMTWVSGSPPPCATTGPTAGATVAHWHCDSCRSCIVAGEEMWVEDKLPGRERRWPDAKLCAKCATPREEGVRVVG